MSAGPTPPPGYQTSQNSGYYSNSNMSYAQQSFPPQAQPSSYSTTPLIQNPFPLPGQEPAGGPGRPSFDPAEEAQLAQWHAQYMSKDDPGSRSGFRKETPYSGSSTPHTSGAALSADTTGASGSGPGGKPLTVVRHGGGKRWEDSTLLDWGDDPRLFVGNLAGEVTDESLLKAFSKYNAFKARVIRDKRTTKSKGYGFVSFKSADDFFTAAKEMVGKYIGSHPVTIKKAEKISTPSMIRDNNRHANKNRKNTTRDGNANTGAGIRKMQKSKGPKLLG